VVIVTGNHYWVDWALGWMVAAASALIASRVLARLRPREWAFRSRGARQLEA
jgi:membrane-associated phospholipid phosphatase